MTGDRRAVISFSMANLSYTERKPECQFECKPQDNTESSKFSDKVGFGGVLLETHNKNTHTHQVSERLMLKRKEERDIIDTLRHQLAEKEDTIHSLRHFADEVHIYI